MAGIFSKIASGEIPSYKIAEDENYFAFLDINPLKEGHTLVIPKEEVDYIFDLDDDVFAGLHLFSKKIADAIKKAFPCERIATAVIGLEVPHAHIHLVPINSMRDIDFSQPKLSLNKDQMEIIVEKIRSHLK